MLGRLPQNFNFFRDSVQNLEQFNVLFGARKSLELIKSQGPEMKKCFLARKFKLGNFLRYEVTSDFTSQVEISLVGKNFIFNIDFFRDLSDQKGHEWRKKS